MGKSDAKTLRVDAEFLKTNKNVCVLYHVRLYLKNKKDGLDHVAGSARSCVHMGEISARLTETKKAPGAWNIKERWRHVNLFRSCFWP